MFAKLKILFCLHDWVNAKKDNGPCLIFYKVCTKCKKVETIVCNGEF